MTIKTSKKRNTETNAALDQAYSAILRDGVSDLKRREERTLQACNILKAIHAIVPITIDGRYDLLGDLEVMIDARNAKRVIGKFRSAGYLFGDASYSLYGQDENGKDLVTVSRSCIGVESGACEHAKGRLRIEWVSPYKAGAKCKIVEQKNEYTSRSLVCNS